MVVRGSTLRNLKIRYLSESRNGKSNALNLGSAHVQGDILLFTDDDVELAEDWVDEMAFPLVSEKCEAVTGKIELADDLLSADKLAKEVKVADRACRKRTLL